MADITFNCPKCRNQLSVDETGVGRMVVCPMCQQSIVIPSAKKPTSFFDWPTLALDKVLDVVKKGLKVKIFDAVANWSGLVGAVGMWVAGLLGVLIGLVLAVKMHQPMMILAGVGWTLFMFLMSYVSKKMLSISAQLIKTSAGELSSDGFLRCLSILALSAAVGNLVFSCVTAFELRIFSPILMGAATFVGLILLVMLWLNPQEGLNIVIKPTTNAGQEALSVMTLMAKSLMRMVPIIFCAGILTGLFKMIWAVLSLVMDKFSPDTDGVWGVLSVTTITSSALLPLIAYLLFLLYYLTFEVLIAILRVPERLEQIRDNSAPKK